jgi:hypothetical protein
VRQEGLGQLKNPIASKENEPATYPLVALTIYITNLILFELV